MKPAAAYSDEVVNIYYAKVDNGGTIAFDDTEDLESFLVSFKDFERMILDGEIDDAKTVIAFYLYNSNIRK